MAASVAFNCASVPVSVSSALPLPTTSAAASPPDTVVDSCSVPYSTCSRSVSGEPAASGSSSVTPVIDSAPSSSTCSAAGACSTGASFTGAMRNVTVSLSMRSPPLPLWPRSLVVSVSVSSP